MNNKTDNEVFIELNDHLTQDIKPSEFLNTIMPLDFFNQYPWSMISNLKKAEQSPQYHPEGNAWNHTLMVVDEAAKVKQNASNVNVFMWAALLHDIGKPDTTRLRKGKWTSYNHEKVGAQMAKEFLEYFKQNQAFIDQVVPLVRWHMQVLFAVKNLSFSEMEAMKQQVDVNDIALLGLCDRMGRLGANEQEEKENIRIFLEKCLK